MEINGGEGVLLALASPPSHVGASSNGKRSPKSPWKEE